MLSKTNRRADGFTIVELLIALALTAMLSTAVALAFNASMQNYTRNESIFKAVTGARQAISRITTQLRTASFVEPNSPADQCNLITDSNDNLTYRFDANDMKIYLVTNDDTTDDDYVLCDNVTDASFLKYPDTEGAIVQNVQLSVTVEVAGFSRKFTSAAVIRRNLD